MIQPIIRVTAKDPASLYKALRRLANVNSGSETGENTATSIALDIKMTQMFLNHPTLPNAE